MGKINDYDIASTPKLEDKLIGTRVGDSPINATFNFSLAGLLALFQENITLQDVLDAGRFIGDDSKTVTLGNTSIVKTILRGTINVANLATSPAGLNVGDLWINGTVINIVT